jgi:hypothetical protein
MNVPLRPLAFILSLLSTSSSFAVDVSHKGNGRYQAVSNSVGGVWIVDSQTGNAKLCFKRNVYEAAPEVNCIKPVATELSDNAIKWLEIGEQEQAIQDALITKMKERIAELEAKKDGD